MGNTINYWIVVHDREVYNESPNVMGFTENAYNAQYIRPNDIIIYYFKGESAIRGIFKVCQKPWARNANWDNECQVEIKPLIIPEDAVDFKQLVPELESFTNKEKWYSHIQGTNSVKKIPLNDYKIIRKYIIEHIGDGC